MKIYYSAGQVFHNPKNPPFTPSRGDCVIQANSIVISAKHVVSDRLLLEAKAITLKEENNNKVDGVAQTTIPSSKRKTLSLLL